MKHLIKKILKEETDQIQIFYKPGDKSWEYTLIKDVWHTRAKGSDNKWFSLGADKFKDTVEELNQIFLGKEIGYWDKLKKKTHQLKNRILNKAQASCNFMIPIAWPTYEPKIEKGSSDFQIWGSHIYALWKTGDFTSKEGTYGKLGHGGVGLIGSNGKVGFFEFGRYEGSDEGMGLTRQPRISVKAQFETDKKGRCRVTNLPQIIKEIKSKSYGEGKTLPLFGHLVPIPSDVWLKRAFAFASQNTQRKYKAIDLEIGDDEFNCGTFIYDVAEAGGLEMGSWCFPDPKSVVDSFQSMSLQKIQA